MLTTRRSDARVTGRSSASGSKWKKCPRTVLPGYAGTGLRPPGDGRSPIEHRVEHVLGQHAGEGVLLAGVVGGNQPVRADRDFRTVGEPRTGARRRMPGRREGPERRVPGERAERD